MAVVEKPIIVLSQLISDLNNGITRCKGDTGYNPELGSIEEKYGISKSDVREIFKHPQLKNLRIKTNTTNYVLQDDVTPKVEDKAVDNSNASTSTSESTSNAETKKEVSSTPF